LLLFVAISSLFVCSLMLSSSMLAHKPHKNPNSLSSVMQLIYVNTISYVILTNPWRRVRTVGSSWRSCLACWILYMDSPNWYGCFSNLLLFGSRSVRVVLLIGAEIVGSIPPERVILDSSLILDNLNFPGLFSFKWL
jgi:hypothetical protein